MGERRSTRSPFKTGSTVCAYLSGGTLLLLLERRHSVWPTWESTGKWWQWRVANLETGEQEWTLENTIAHYHVLG